MEGSIGPEMAPAPVDSFNFGLTRSNSDASSLTSDILNNNLHRTANLITESMPWTNEKHNKYLDYLEASFIRQLHKTIDSVTCFSEQIVREENISQKLSFKPYKTSEEIFSLPDGQCHEINLGEDHPHPHPVAQTQSLVVKGPCEYRFRHAYKDSSSTSLQELPKIHSPDKNLKDLKINHHRSSCSEESYTSEFCHHDSDESVIEGTDQNFVDEGCQNYRHGAFRAKKLKMGTLQDTPNSDKIPIGQLYALDNWVRDHSLRGGEGAKYA